MQKDGKYNDLEPTDVNGESVESRADIALIILEPQLMPAFTYVIDDYVVSGVTLATLDVEHLTRMTILDIELASVRMNVIQF